MRVKICVLYDSSWRNILWLSYCWYFHIGHSTQIFGRQWFSFVGYLNASLLCAHLPQIYVPVQCIWGLFVSLTLSLVGFVILLPSLFCTWLRLPAQIAQAAPHKIFLLVQVFFSIETSPFISWNGCQLIFVCLQVCFPCNKAARAISWCNSVFEGCAGRATCRKGGHLYRAKWICRLLIVFMYSQECSFRANCGSMLFLLLSLSLHTWWGLNLVFQVRGLLIQCNSLL